MFAGVFFLGCEVRDEASVFPCHPGRSEAESQRFRTCDGENTLSIASSSTAERSEDPSRAFKARGQVPRWALRQPAAVEGDACRGYVLIKLILSDVEAPNSVHAFTLKRIRD